LFKKFSEKTYEKQLKHALITTSIMQARYYSTIEQKKSNGEKEVVVNCKLCPRDCKIKEGQVGFCNVRKNVNGKLVSLVYGKAAGGLSIDPIEKKPLFHFMPGNQVLSFGTVGCNLRCKNCQNYTTSQMKPGQEFEKDFSPKDIVRVAKENDCKIIAYTYNEPTIFFEYMIDTAKLAKKAGIKNIIVSNGYINEEPLRELCKYIDGANIDLKGYNEIFYGKITSGTLAPILKSLKILKEEGVFEEVTNLLIPSINDDLAEIKKMCDWVKENLGETTPIHFSAFYPTYKLLNIPRTPTTTLLNAYDIAKQKGLKHVYLGNITTRDYDNTTCPNCNNTIIERLNYNVIENNILKGKCKFCQTPINGVWE